MIAGQRRHAFFPHGTLEAVECFHQSHAGPQCGVRSGGGIPHGAGGDVVVTRWNCCRSLEASADGLLGWGAGMVVMETARTTTSSLYERFLNTRLTMLFCIARLGVWKLFWLF